MRTLRIVLILLVLIGFPALSWLYLSSGLRWRVTAQEETVKKEALMHFALMDSDSNALTPDNMTGTFYLIATPQDSTAFHHLQLVNTQFEVRPDFRTLTLLTDTTSAEQPVDSAWIRAICTQGCDSLRARLFSPDFTAAIVDDSLRVRGRYHISSTREMRKMVEHLAVVLPIEKRERIQLKRGAN